MQIESSIGLILNTIGAFIISIFVSLSLERWWTIRTHISSIIGNCNEFALITGTFIKDKNIKEHLLRLTNAIQYLIYNQAAGNSKALVELSDKKILTPDECRILRKTVFGAKYILVIRWCTELLESVFSGENISSFINGQVYLLLQTNINTMRQSAARIFAILNTQIPYTYIHIVTIVTKMHILLVTLWTSTLIGEGIIYMSVMRIIIGYFICTINTLIFEGLLEIHAQLYQPFGDKPWQFPTDDYVANSHLCSKTLIRKLEKPKFD